MSNQELSPVKLALLEKWRKGQLNNASIGIPPRPVDQPIALSFPQRRQLFLELLERGTAVNNLSTILQIKGNLDLGVLEQSANQILLRHEILRTRFSFGLGLPVPEVLPEVAVPLPVFDLRGLELSKQEGEALRLAEKEVLKPFNLNQAPLIRLTLYRLGNEEYLLLLTVHHTIADGWSLGVFLRELMLFYRAISSGQPVELPQLPIQYADFAHWQTDDARQEKIQPSLDYWKKQLGGEIPVLELSTDRPRGARQTFSGGTHRFVLSTALNEALEKLSREEDATLFMTLITAFFILLQRYSGQDEVLIGTPIANRNLPELENLIGVFINTLVLRAHFSGNPSFRDLLKQVRSLSLEAYAHQDLPFERLVEVLKPQRDLSRPPLFQVVFNLQNSPLPKLDIPGLQTGFVEINRGVSQFDLTLMVSRLDGQCHATVEYNEDLFAPATIARMFRSFHLILEYAIAKPDYPIAQLPLLSKAEEQHLIYTLNQTQLDFPSEKCVHQFFEAQVDRTPEAVAVMYGNNSLTYHELNRRANGLARQLQDLELGPAIQVGILMDKSPEILVALLAVLKAGGVYVPIHPSFPAERIQFMLKDAKVQVLLTNVVPELGELENIRIVKLNEDRFNDTIDWPNPQFNISTDDLAYIMYTSGSTGQPKGVMVQHAALVNFLWSMRQKPGISAEDVLLSVTSITFDIAALELYLPLIAGARVVIASQEMVSNPRLIGEAIDQYQVSMMQATPATWQLLLETGWKGAPGLKALCGGDVLTRRMADQLLTRVGSLWNMYGPTETTIWSSVCQIQPGNAPITIGQAIGNTQLYILDRHLQVLPIGVIGELHIGGQGLARGYWDRPDLTKERFIPDRFRSDPSERLYKTGDSARYLPDHSIEILGRSDDQVKINGNRIELGEIRTVLMQYPTILEAIVLTRTETSGNKQLLAYFVPQQDTVVVVDTLRDFVRKKLPAYMIPSSFVRLDKLPLTPNGKIDRKALPLPEDLRQRSGYLAPRNEEEELLASIWQDVLSIEQVGVHDNFFDLGGASIQSLQIVAKANMFGFQLRVEHIFEYQTIAELAEQFKKG
ncbi:non-ribosomal peptide synthetase [Haliscomenobacter sp.]|uniref:non-ribosomal peptide synthetase n=1 Tax=Haliscomenobacter sp. TaxID=2717303 RepID=UPI003BABA594